MNSREIGLAFHSSIIDELIELGFRPELGLPSQKPGCDVDFDWAVKTFCAFRVDSVLLWFASANELKSFSSKVHQRFEKTLKTRKLSATIKVLDIAGVDGLPVFQAIRTIFFSMKLDESNGVIGVSLCS